MDDRLARWKQKARQLKTETIALYFAYRDARTPWYAKLAAALVVGYAFSPIDLIPDFVPVLGYLDDLLLVPLGIALALALIPPEVMADCREKATSMQNRPVNRAAAVVIVGLWLLLPAVAIRLVADALG